MSEELAARLMARIAVPPMPFAPDTYTAGRMDQFTEMITQLRALPEVDKEQVLADAKARIEGLGRNVEGDAQSRLRALAYNQGRDDALAALTQPQTEKGCPACFGPFDGVVCRCPDGGGAATPRGVADALTLTPGEARNLVDAAMGDEHYPQLLDSTVKRIGDEADRQLAEPTPYAKAFRERVCPVPEFPSVGTAPQEAQADPKKDVCPNCGEVANGCNYCRKTPAPVPQTEGECPDCEGTGKVTTTMVNDWLICPTCSGTGKEGEK